MAFIDDMRANDHAVESTCRVLTEHGCKVAARTYRPWKQAHGPVAARTVTDAAIIDTLLTARGTPERPLRPPEVDPLATPAGPRSRVLHRRLPDA